MSLNPAASACSCFFSFFLSNAFSSLSLSICIFHRRSFLTNVPDVWPSTENKRNLKYLEFCSRLMSEAKAGNDESADDAFDCNICMSQASEPVTTQCGHLFCWPCLHVWLQQGKNDCPGESSQCIASAHRTNIHVT